MAQSVSPSSRFMIGVVFLTHMASVIHICVSVALSVCLCFLSFYDAIVSVCYCRCFCLLLQMFLSVIADLCSTVSDFLICSRVNRPVVMFSISFLCSSSLVSTVLPVSPTYVQRHLLHGIHWYTLSLVPLFSTLSFGCTSIRLMF